MKLFTKCLNQCIQEQKTNKKIELLHLYFQQESQENIPIAFHLLMGENFGRFCASKLLRQWCAELTNLPQWIIDESYESLGDNSETIALCFSKNLQKKVHTLKSLHDTLIKLKTAHLDIKKQWITQCWTELPSEQIYTFNKLLGGGIRIGASKKNVLKALSKLSNIDPNVLEHRLLGTWSPTQEAFNALIQKESSQEKGIRPYPFYLASSISEPIQSTLTNINEWTFEPKWDGIRAQIIHRKDDQVIWSRGHELISNQFPEITNKIKTLPYGVYDGEIVAWKDDKPLPFFELQKRLNRKKVSSTLIEKTPCCIQIYDCLEYNDKDIRHYPLINRLSHIKETSLPFLKSQLLTVKSLDDINAYMAEARNNNIEGIMIKHKQSSYKSGRIRGHWWKLKVNPLRLDVVIMYAQKGKGQRTGLYTDYTFGVWNEKNLVPIGKAYSGLTNQEIKTVNSIIKKHLTDKFGPVRAMKPCVVLEIAFDNIQPSSRHKSGLALRFPRIHRLRLDKPIEEANSLKDAHNLCNK